MKNLLRIQTGLISTMVAATLCAPFISHGGGFVAVWGENNYGQTRLPNGLDDIKAIAAGNNHNLALRADGTVVAWGLNEHKQTNVPPTLSQVMAIAAGHSHNLALKADGTVAAWGGNWAGQTNVPQGLSNVIAIAAGVAHNLVLKSDGTLAAWGSDYFGVTNVPSGTSECVAIATGDAHNLALKADGRVIAWGGANSYGELNVPTNLSNVIAIAAGVGHNLALKRDGTVVAWGYNGQGQINVPADLSNVVEIAAGSYQSLAIKADGSVVAWGLDDRLVASLPVGLHGNTSAIEGGSVHAIALVFSGPVQIVEEPQSQTVAYTSNATFSVVATGAEPLSYQWLKNGSPLSDNTRYAGRTNATLIISNAQFSDAGNYSVMVSNEFGSVMSTSAVLSVIGPPVVVEHSASRTVRAGINVSLTVIAQGTPPLQYQWTFNGSSISGATNSLLVFTNIQPAASGVYVAHVTNAYGHAQTAPITRTVTNSAPLILAQPTNQTASLGGNANFTVTASGSLPMTYQWRFEGENIPNATNATLALSNLRYDQSGFYSVEVSNAFGQTNSAKAFLNVTQLRVWGDPFSGNTNIPAGLTNVIAVSAGSSHIIALKDDGTAKVWATSQFATNVPISATNVVAVAAGGDLNSLALRANGTVVAWRAYYTTEEYVPPGLSNVISIAASSSRRYAVKSDGTVVAWGTTLPSPVALSNIVKISAAASHNVALQRDGTVIAWGSSGIPSYLTNLSGLSNAIDVAAGSGGNIALRKDGTVWVSPGSRILLPTNLSDRVAIAVGSMTGAALKQDGTVTSAGSFGKNPMPNLSNVTAIAIGGVQADFGVAIMGDGTPRITLQPYSQIVSRSNVVQLHARAVGVQPMSYQWQLDNENIPGATNASLLITNMQGQHTGGYRMLAANPLGSVFSATANLTIPFNTNLAAALNATNLVWDSFSSTSKTEKTWFAQIRETHDGEAAAQSGAISHNQQSQLLTTVTGPGTLTFWWKVSSEAGYDHLRFHLDSQGIPLAMISGEVGWEKKSFSIPQGTHVLRWTYSKDGTVNSGRDAGWVDEVVFTQPLPIIIRHPSSRTVLMGSNVMFAASAEGVGPLSYQWVKDGTNLPGRTVSFFTLTNVTPNDAGAYAMRVSNPYGSVTTSNAILTVLVSQVLEPLQILPDGSAMLWSRVELVPENLDAFQVQASTNFLNWATLPGAPVFTNGALRFHDTNNKNFPMRFYRIVEH